MKSTARLSLSLAVLAILCAAGLDYIQARKGERAYIFPSQEAPAASLAPEESLASIVLRYAAALGLAPDAVSQYRDNEGIQHMMIDLTPEEYQRLESLLDKEFTRIQAEASKDEQEQPGGKRYFLWRVRSRRNELLSLLFSSSQEIPPPEKPKPAPLSKNRVAIIVDDMGHSLEAIYEICAMQMPLTIAILPFSPLARETASIAHQNQLEVILHLPLESLYNVYDNNHTEGIIHSRMNAREIADAVEYSLIQVPYITGVNTHMGSKITSEAGLIRQVLAHIKGKDLFFIDSRTTHQSVAYDMAQQMGIPSAYRHVFLDSEIDERFIKNQLLKLFQTGQRNGPTVAICHPTLETLNVLKENLHRFKDHDLEIVFASQIVH